MGEKIVSDLRAAINDDMRQQHCTAADFDICFDDGIGPNVSFRPDFCGSMHHRGRMDSGLIARWVIEDFNSLRKCKVGILRPQSRCGYGREVHPHNYGTSPRCLGSRGIFWVRDECDLVWAGFINSGDSGDFCVRRRVFQRGSEL